MKWIEPKRPHAHCIRLSLCFFPCPLLCVSPLAKRSLCSSEMQRGANIYAGYIEWVTLSNDAPCLLFVLAIVAVQRQFVVARF